MSSGGAALRELAPAKINLFLHIVGRRADGMHLLDSLVVFAKLGDIVTVRPGKSLSLTRDGPMADDLPPVEEDLVFRAANLLAELAPEPAGAAIHVEKNLPVAAGIGGGTADAAAAIRALVRLWCLDLPADRLTGFVEELGADFPVCLESQPSRVGGIGEQISSPGQLAPLHAVLINPRVAISTAEVFAGVAAISSGQAAESAVGEKWAAEPRELALQLAACRNDLADAAISLCPAIGDVLTALTGRPDCLLSRMSGSGTTCFGLFATSAEAEAAAVTLQHENPDWWIVATPLDADSD